MATNITPSFGSAAGGHNRPKVSLRTFGCRLNQAETADIAASFINTGYDVVPFGMPCDVCVIHACAVTSKAESEALKTARKIKKDQPDCRVVMAGCVSEVVPASSLYKLGIDLVVGQKDKYKIPSFLSSITLPAPSGNVPFFENTRALLKIQDGCNFFCSYCVVPYARGPAHSLPFHEIIEKARRLADSGFREIVITGANIGTYNYERKNLIHVLEAIESIDSISRLRLSSLEISTIEYPLFYHMASSAKLCRYLHIPMQSGDDEILRNMNRRYSSIDYRAAVEKAVECMPGIGLGTDIIAGFPGESDEAFMATFKLASLLPFSNLHVFPFSPRQFTKAQAMKNRIPSSSIKARTTRLITLGHAKRAEFAKKLIHHPVNVLIEKTGETTSEGWSGEYAYVVIKKGSLPLNSIVKALPLSYMNDHLTADFDGFV